MARKFKELQSKMSPESRARVEARVRETLREMELKQLRQAKEVTQELLADLLKTTQSEVSKIERRPDLRVSTLRRYIEALGAQLEIVARFPDGEAVAIRAGELEAA